MLLSWGKIYWCYNIINRKYAILNLRLTAVFNFKYFMIAPFYRAARKNMLLFHFRTFSLKMTLKPPLNIFFRASVSVKRVIIYISPDTCLINSFYRYFIFRMIYFIEIISPFRNKIRNFCK